MATAADERMDVGTRGTSSPWWVVLLQGVFATIFGLLLLIEPGSTLLFLIQVLGFYLLIEGILRIVSIFVDSSLWGLKLSIGILGLLAGIVVLNKPLWSATVVPAYIVYVIGFLAMFEGIAGLVHAFQGGGWGVGILGVLTSVIGLILVFNPLIGVLALPFVLGGFMLAGGLAAIVASFRLRSSPAGTAVT